MMKSSVIIRLCVLAAAVLSFCLPADSQEPGIKAVNLDFRTQVMTLTAMKEFAEKAARSGMNAILIEWEASFPFSENLVLRNRNSFSEPEVREFISWCASLGIEVIPIQNCFGHSEYILRHDRYASLKEDRKDCSQVCPLKLGEAEEVFRSIFGEIAGMHPSEYIHIGCDETRLLGHCPECRKAVQEKGIAGIYGEYVAKMCSIVSDLGKTPMIWADIVLKYPDAIDWLPENTVIVDWNYGWSPDWFGKMENIENSGHIVWGACSLRSHPDNLYLVQWRKHLENIFGYTSYAKKHGFKGIVNTSWSTSGTYGYVYDDNNEVVDMQPVREVYPYSGFDMLSEAYFAALSGKYVSPDEFLDAYCRKRLGLVRDTDIAAVKNYFNMPQLPVHSFGGSIEKAENELDKCMEVRRDMDKVKFPACACNVAAHLDLMLDIRINYLAFKIIEMKSEAVEFNESDIRNMSAGLAYMIAECEKLRKRFEAINDGYLKEPGQPFNEWTYYGKMKNLYATLRNIQNHTN